MTSQYHSFCMFSSFLLIFGYTSDQAKSVNQYKPEIEVNTSYVKKLTIQTTTDSIKYCITSNKIGAGGYDVVNYFENNTAEIGSPSHQYTYDGVIYNFINSEHKGDFIKDAEKYLPAFGGWCSMTLAMGRATTPTYDNFKILNGKLYLFEKTLSINGQTLWNQNPEENQKIANKNYLDYIDDGVINPTKN